MAAAPAVHVADREPEIEIAGIAGQNRLIAFPGGAQPAGRPQRIGPDDRVGGIARIGCCGVPGGGDPTQRAIAPAITGGIGELPPLMVMTAGGLVAVTDRVAAPAEAEKKTGTDKDKPARKKQKCGGGLAALGCAFD